MAELNLVAQKKYLHDKIQSATAVGRVIILYDACNRFMKEGLEALDNNDKVVFVEKIIRSQNIVRELRNALNLDLDPKIGGNFYRLYTYFLKRLMEGNRKKDRASIQFVINQMDKLNASWKEIEAKGLAKDVKRFEERIGTKDPSIVKTYAPSVESIKPATSTSGSVLETLNLSI